MPVAAPDIQPWNAHNKPGVFKIRCRDGLSAYAFFVDGSLTQHGQTGRKASNLSRTLKTIEDYGFVRLHRGERGRVRPEVPYQSICLELPFSA